VRLFLQIAKIQQDDKLWLYNACAKIVTDMEGAATVALPSPRQQRKESCTWKDQFLAEIDATLKAYESQQMVQFTVDVNTILEAVKTDYSTMSKEQQFNCHQHLVSLELKTNMLLLLVCVARGKLYDAVKQKASLSKKKALADTFLFSPTQAYKYIKFAAKVKQYPRLLACGKSFTEITAHMSVIEEKADTDATFHALLVGRIYEIKCGAELVTFDECFKKL
jgi:hypothetical protein